MVMNANTDGNLGKLGRYRGNNPSGDSAASTLRPDQGGTAIVGSYSPNSWGLYDVYGNVAEFCVDLIEDDITSYGGKVNVDPASPGKTLSGKDVSNHVYRGGAWYYNAGDCRAAIRPGGSSSYRAYDRGIRVVCQAGLQ
jgi:formylglycine-generating enzyme required for sulfatase activity